MTQCLCFWLSSSVWMSSLTQRRNTTLQASPSSGRGGGRIFIFGYSYLDICGLLCSWHYTSINSPILRPCFFFFFLAAMSHYWLMFTSKSEEQSTSYSFKFPRTRAFGKNQKQCWPSHYSLVLLLSGTLNVTFDTRVLGKLIYYVDRPLCIFFCT